MKRLLLIATVLAVFGAAPAVASATVGFVAGGYPATTSATPTGSIVLSAEGTSAECKGSLSGTLAEPAAAAGVGSTGIPSCSGGSLELNGCQIVLHPGSSSGGIGPAKCGPVRLWLNSCPGGAFTIEPQEGLSATYENVGSGKEATVKVSLSGSVASTSKNLCSSGHPPVSISGTLSLKASNEGGQVGVSVTNELPTGLAIEPSEGGGAEVAATAYPSEIVGERFYVGGGDEKAILLQVGTVKAGCSNAAANGGKIEAAQGSLSLAVAFSNCKIGSLAATTNMNSCRYRIGGLAFHAGLPFSGQPEITCNAGDAIVMQGQLCTVRIPAQSLGGGYAELENIGSGFASTVAAGFSADKVKYSSKGLGCSAIFGKTGEFEDGSTRALLLLKGLAAS